MILRCAERDLVTAALHLRQQLRVGCRELRQNVIGVVVPRTAADAPQIVIGLCLGSDWRSFTAWVYPTEPASNWNISFCSAGCTVFASYCLALPAP